MVVSTVIFLTLALKGAKNVRHLAALIKLRQDHAPLITTGPVHRKPLYRQFWPLVSLFFLLHTFLFVMKLKLFTCFPHSLLTEETRSTNYLDLNYCVVDMMLGSTEVILAYIHIQTSVGISQFSGRQ